MAAAAATTTTAFPFNLTREQYIYMAKLAKKAERYEEMAKFMKNLVIGLPTPVSELTIEERYLLSMAYKEVSGSLRSAWRIISSKEKSRKNDVDIDIVVVKYYRSEIEDKISDVCLGILKILESNLVPSASRADSKVFYLKMKGDYFRYLAEFKVGDERREAGEQAMNSYKAAQDIAEADMDPTHPLRLGVALDFSVFYYEILNSAYIACSMAKKAYMDAFDELDNVSEECYKDSTRIMQLLRNNLTLWTSNTQV